MSDDSTLFLSELGDMSLEKFLQDVRAGKLTRWVAMEELRRWQSSCQVDSDLYTLLEEVEDYIQQLPDESAANVHSAGDEKTAVDHPERGREPSHPGLQTGETT